MRDCTYEERLKILKLPSLKYRRYRGDLIQTFKIIKGIDDLKANGFYVFNHNNTRDSDVKLYVKFCHSDTKKFSFSYRTTNFWNALSSLTKKAKTLDHFKVLLDNDDNKLIDCFDYD